MDIVSHGLYGGAPFFNKTKKSFWTAVWWGVFPDLFAFGIFFPGLILTRILNPEKSFFTPPPPPSMIPNYVYQLYELSHSIIIFAVIFVLIWYWKKRPIYEMFPWGLHILMDIPTHSNAFFPTPFLYPISPFHINGIAWATGWFFLTYWVILIAVYAYLFVKKRKQGARGEIMT